MVELASPPIAPLPIEPPPGADASFVALCDRIREEGRWLSDRLLERGALVLRGYGVDRLEQFSEAIALLSNGGSLRDYAGGASPRAQLNAGERPVYNSTEYPPHIELPLHNELSYTDAYPERIYFFCQVAPRIGGATTLGDSRRILATMPPRVRSDFEEKGLCYIRTLPSDEASPYSWQGAFACGERATVERRCGAMGAEFEWLADGFLRIMQRRPATAVHPQTGEQVWFNQADGFHPSALDPASYCELMAAYGSEDRFRLNVTFGDGTPIMLDALDEVRRVLRRETVPHHWRKGDILVLDNLLAAHGRAPFSGERRIAVAMT